MNKSESIVELAKALCEAQAEMSGAKKSAANPFYKSAYADLSEVINCAKEPLHNNGLSISQFPLSEEGKAGVNTILMHTSGEFLESTLLLTCAKNDPQGMGSAITYARRYAYQSCLGIPSEDDDGNSASAPKPTYKQPAAQPKPPTITKKAILDAFKACKDSVALEAKYKKALSTEFAKDADVVSAYAVKAQELSK
jgi:hypothetical protein